MMFCPNCGQADQEAGRPCSRCGLVLPVIKDKETGWGRLAVIGCVGVGLLSVVVAIALGWMLFSSGTWQDVVARLGGFRSLSPVTPSATDEKGASGGEPATEGLPPLKTGLSIPIGQVATVGTWQVIVNDVRVDESFVPLKGGRFVVVDWTLKNNSDHGAFLAIGGPPDPTRLSLMLRDRSGRESIGWFYNQVDSGYAFMAAPGDVMRTRFYFEVGRGSLEDVQLVMTFPEEVKRQTLFFDLVRRAPEPVDLLPTPPSQSVGFGQRVVVADRWAFTVHGIDVNAGEDETGERVVKVDLTAENLQQQPRIFGVTERVGAAERRDFYLVDEHGYLAYSRADQMPEVEIGPGESRRVTLWLYTHDLSPRSRYRLSLVLDWQADQYAIFELNASAGQAAHAGG